MIDFEYRSYLFWLPCSNMTALYLFFVKGTINNSPGSSIFSLNFML